MEDQPSPSQLSGDEYVAFILDRDFDLFIYVNSVVFWLIVIALAIVVATRLLGPNFGLRAWKTFEIDEAQFGLGNQKLILRPNNTDRQIAYKIWVELSTRKIGLPIDLENDVISEVYDSWYNFFSVTRELIKDVPVSKFRRKDTEKIVRLSIEVLNAGIRPHLTQWQARFRRWYDRALTQEDDLSPQEVQRKFPEYNALKEDLEQVNERLIGYRDKMYELVTNL